VAADRLDPGRSAAEALSPERVADVLGQALGEPVTVTAVERLTGGASRQTWAATAVTATGARTVVVRLGGAGEGAGLVREARLLQAAADAGVPVPAVVAASASAHELGAPYLVMGHVPGESVPRRILTAPELATARRGLAAECGRVLAAIHRIPPSAVPGLEAGDPLERLGVLAAAVGAAQPALELGLRWLAEHRPHQREPVVVHGDFRLGNLLVGPDGLQAVLDWELAHLGDPLEDLGWLCAEPWRFGSAPAVGGFGTVEDLVDAYGEASGRAVGAEELDWWRVYALVRWGLICLVQVGRHISGARRSVDLAAVGRRLCETEWDLLRAIGLARATPPTPGAWEPETAAGDVRSDPPHDPPSAVQLLEAVEALLRGPAAEASTGMLRYELKVAANVVAMVARQLRLGPAQQVEHRRRLAALGVADDAALAAAIRTGALDDQQQAVARAVVDAVVAKLLVANPRYLATSAPERPG